MSEHAPLDAAAAAEAAFARAQSQPFPDDIFTAPQLNWAVIGCGVIANQMAESLALAGRRLAGVANRTASKAHASFTLLSPSCTLLPLRAKQRFLESCMFFSEIFKVPYI